MIYIVISNIFKIQFMQLPQSLIWPWTTFTCSVCLVPCYIWKFTDKANCHWCNTVVSCADFINPL